MISVIISIYKNLDNLYLIFLGLEKQSYKDFEIIISEDADNIETKVFIEQMRQRFSTNIKHISQEDIGFRKTKILNKALLISSGEYIVFLDGDCIPHYRLLESYSRYLKPNTVCLGRRCFLSEKLTRKLHLYHNLNDINIISLLKNASHLDHAFYIKKLPIGKSNRKISGCNWGVDKQSLMNVNGFDEDYLEAGVGEDHDIDWRLKKNNTTFINIKRIVIVYHLYHKDNYNQDSIDRMNKLEESKKKEGHIVCKNGIKKIHYD